MTYQEIGEQIFAAIGVLVVIATPLAEGLEAAAARLSAHAATTPTDTDDAIAERVMAATVTVASVLRWIAALLPVIRLRGALR